MLLEPDWIIQRLVVLLPLTAPHRLWDSRPGRKDAKRHLCHNLLIALQWMPNEAESAKGVRR